MSQSGSKSISELVRQSGSKSISDSVNSESVNESVRQ